MSDVKLRPTRGDLARAAIARLSSELAEVKKERDDLRAGYLRELSAANEMRSRLSTPPIVGEDAPKLDWSLCRRILEQGMAIQQDYAAGKYPDYELLSARLDEAARERVAAAQSRQEAGETGT